MKYPDLIPVYAHLVCNEALSEETEDAAQHLFQRAVNAGLVRSDEGHEGAGLCFDTTIMVRLMEVSADAADKEVRRLAIRLEALLRQEFSTKLMRH